jgi:hypothetical protein
MTFCFINRHACVLTADVISLRYANTLYSSVNKQQMLVLFIGQFLWEICHLKEICLHLNHDLLDKSFDMHYTSL